jgi:hypothetical protein
MIKLKNNFIVEEYLKFFNRLYDITWFGAGCSYQKHKLFQRAFDWKLSFVEPCRILQSKK